MSFALSPARPLRLPPVLAAVAVLAVLALPLAPGGAEGGAGDRKSVV